jgi:choline dehydrogenase-like flavoprotein
VVAQATNPSDSAFFYSYDSDVFNGSPAESTLTGSAAGFASFSSFAVAATGFQSVTVEESGDGADVANLSSPGGGVFVSTPTVSTLAINGVTVITVMTLFSNNGTFQAAPSQVNVTGAGTDTAYLYDGTGSNSLVASGNTATLTREENSVSVSQFGLVIAEQTLGNEDTVSEQALDFALRLIGNWTSD